MTITEQWRAWTEKGVQSRRRLIVQTINMNRLAYEWQSFERAMENIHFLGVSPENAIEAIIQRHKPIVPLELVRVGDMVV